MIGRRTTLHLAELFEFWFGKLHLGSSGKRWFSIDGNRVHDFLYENDFQPWFCELGRATDYPTNTRKLVDLILGLHTGKSIQGHALDYAYSYDEITEIGQELLAKLASDILAEIETVLPEPPASPLVFHRDRLLNSLALDGYKYQDHILLTAESEIFDTQETAGVLTVLHKELGLGHSEIAFSHLKLSEEHYLAGRWGDCISNSRNFLEAILQEIAASYSLGFDNKTLDNKIYETAGLVRNYLESVKLIEEKERKTLSEVYGLLSDTGSHPYIAEKDQARLLRQMSLILSEFIMLRYQGRLGTK